jgi:hypothetical protein
MADAVEIATLVLVSIALFVSIYMLVVSYRSRKHSHYSDNSDIDDILKDHEESRRSKKSSK